jgi:chromosome transmission fidelity protein 1
MDNAKAYTSDQFYNEFYDLLQSDLSKMKMVGNNNNINISKSKEPAMEDAARNGNFMCFAKQSPQKRTYDVTEKAKMMNYSSSSQSQLMKKEDNANKGAHVLAQKMKELDMMDSGDLEHVLDIEEALHYYSRLKSPVYVDIVDKFFKDINSEFIAPQPSVSFKSSKERLGPIQLYKR